MTSSIKKAAEEYVRGADSWIDDGYRPHEHTFLAGDAHGFARAVKMLKQFKCPVNSDSKAECTCAHSQMEAADWLEKQEKEKGGAI